MDEKEIELYKLSTTTSIVIGSRHVFFFNSPTSNQVFGEKNIDVDRISKYGSWINHAQWYIYGKREGLIF